MKGVVLGIFIGFGIIALAFMPLPISRKATVQAQSKVPSAAPPAQQQAEQKKSEHGRQFYGRTFYEGVITSVYYYPEGPDANHSAAQTHIKFDHDDNLDVWFCGDQRARIKPGPGKRRIMLSYEPSTDCVTNWEFAR